MSNFKELLNTLYELSSHFEWDKKNFYEKYDFLDTPEDKLYLLKIELDKLYYTYHAFIDAALEEFPYLNKLNENFRNDLDTRMKFQTFSNYVESSLETIFKQIPEFSKDSEKYLNDVSFIKGYRCFKNLENEIKDLCKYQENRIKETQMNSK